MAAAPAAMALGWMHPALANSWNAGSGNWNTPGNWNPVGVPGNGAGAFISTSGASPVTVTYNYSGSAITLANLSVDYTGPASGGGNTLLISSNLSVTAEVEYFGFSGSATVDQSAGSNTITGNYLNLGYSAGSIGTYSLSSSGSLTAEEAELVGENGQGTFNQSGGTNTVSLLEIGNASGSAGIYSLSASGSLTASTENIGEYGNGTFIQTGGTNTLSAGLTVAYQPGSSGTYSLSGSASLTAQGEQVGVDGNGTFLQTGGTNTASGNLSVAYQAGSSGIYSLSGTSTLTAAGEDVGTGANGTFIQSGGSNTINTSGSAGLIVGDQSGANGTYNLSGGNLTINNSGGLTVGNQAGSTGTFSLSASGSLTAQDEYIGDNGNGAFNQTGGTNTASGYFYVGYFASGTYTLQSGSLSSGEEEVGFSGSGTFTQTGGTNTIGHDLELGFNPTGTGNYTIDGGTLNTFSVLFGQSGGTGAFIVSGTGVANISGAIFPYTTNSTLVLSGGLLNIEGNGIASAANPIGTVELPAPGQTAGIQSLGGAGINGAGLDMNGGGTLLLIGTSNFYTGGTTIAANSTIQVGGFGGIYSTIGSLPATGNVDDEGALQFSQSNNITLSSTISGAGTVIGDSSGTTTLSGINTYSGATYIPFGTLAVNGELYHGVGSAPNVNVSGGTLAGTGTIHAGITLNSGTIAPGLAGSTLNADGGLTADGGALQFDVGASTASELALGGSASFSGGVNVDFTLSGTPTSGSIFTILTSTGLSGAASLNLTPTVIGTDTLTPSVDGNDLIVTVSGGGGGGAPSSLSWNNAGGSPPSDGQNWDIGVNNNWNNGTSVTTYADGDDVTFNDNNNGNYSVTLNTTVNPGSVTVTNKKANYSITGSGTINDTGVFIKAGAGTLTLGTGLTAASLSISSGTLALATNTTLGNGSPLAPTSNVNISSLTITLGSVLDIANNHILIDYTASDPISTIQQYLLNGFNGGHWNGTSGNGVGAIISSAAALNSHYGIGWADGKDGVVSGLSSGQIEIKYTLLGDANLDGIVNGSDFSILAANFGQGATNWDQGNFLFGSSVNGSDFSALAANFGQGDSGAAVAVSPADIAALDAFAVANNLPLPTISVVPEPAIGAMMLSGAFLVLPRRRRRRAFEARAN
jgi:autotransporter-associated beta strand protein